MPKEIPQNSDKQTAVLQQKQGITVRFLQRIILVSLLSAPIFALGCKGVDQATRTVSPHRKAENNQNATPTPRVNAKFRVLVIDDGFDDSLPVYGNKVIGRYSIQCTDTPSFLNNSKQLPFDQLKGVVLQEIRSNKDECQIVQQMNLKKSPAYASIMGYLAQWNQMFLQKSAPTLNNAALNQVDNVLSGSDGYNYHGTNTSSLIAYKNDKIEMILMQMELLKSGESGYTTADCRTQEEVDKIARVYSDPEVVKAYVEAPLTQTDRMYEDILVNMNIDLINTSFGSEPTKVMEQSLIKIGCAPASYGNFNRVLNELQQKQDNYRSQNGSYRNKALVINAFGNDAATLDSAADGSECTMTDTLNVAATDQNGNLAEFTNRGRCMDVLAPGVDVVTTFPGGFLSSVDGTSFSAPLFVRYLTQTMSPQLTYDDVYQRYKGSNTNIGWNQMPQELAYQNPAQIGVFALSGDNSQTPPKPRPVPMKRFRFGR